MQNSILDHSGRFDRRMALATAWIVLSLLLATGVQADDEDASSKRELVSYGRPGLSIFELELPLDFEARVDGFYTRQRHAIDALAYDRWQNPGPYVRRDSLVESRISVGREIWSGIDLELAWATQTPLSLSSAPSPDRQMFGAFLRFSH